MNKAEPIVTLDELLCLGFTPDNAVMSEAGQGLSFDFGGFKLSAGAVTNEYLRPVVLFTGVLATPRTLSEVCFELPRKISSTKRLTAFLAYYLDKASGSSTFRFGKNVDWIADGRQNKHLLPWEVDMAAYKERPHCSVQRKWLRLALNSLSEIISDANEQELVEFAFDGSVLKILCSGQVVAIPGEGKPWISTFTIAAGTLGNLPKRLMRDPLVVSFWRGRLHLGSYCYDGVKEG